jgi:cupin 2 domain-containing protein
VSARNLFDGIPERLPHELTEILAAGNAVRIERIVSQGHASPDGFWYDQDEDEWVLLLSGSAGLRFEGEDRELRLKPGDHLHIPAHRRHRVAWTAEGIDTVWLAVFFSDGTQG